MVWRVNGRVVRVLRMHHLLRIRVLRWVSIGRHIMRWVVKVAGIRIWR